MPFHSIVVSLSVGELRRNYLACQGVLHFGSAAECHTPNILTNSKSAPTTSSCSRGLNIVISRHRGPDRLGPSRRFHAPLHRLEPFRIIGSSRARGLVQLLSVPAMPRFHSIVFAAPISKTNVICSFSVIICISFSFRNTSVSSHTEFQSKECGGTTGIMIIWQWKPGHFVYFKPKLTGLL